MSDEREKLRVGQRKDGVAERLRRDVEKQAAYTLLNRLVVLRLMEAQPARGEPLRGPAVVTGGWESRGYKDFRTLAPSLVRHDTTEGYALLLGLVFEDLATELPGIFGSAGLADLREGAVGLAFSVGPESVSACATWNMKRSCNN